MNEFKTVDDILDFAILQEEAAAEFYTELAERADRPEMREAFEDFAEEENSHKKKLMSLKKGKTFKLADEKVADLRIGDYLPDVAFLPDMDFQEALILAMKKEKAAFRLYHDLAEQATDRNARTVFLTLAMEEAKHKLRFELEYDEHYLAEN